MVCLEDNGLILASAGSCLVKLIPVLLTFNGRYVLNWPSAVNLTEAHI